MKKTQSQITAIKIEAQNAKSHSHEMATDKGFAKIDGHRCPLRKRTKNTERAKSAGG